VRHELASVEPDFIVYYEGANQFRFRELLTNVDESAAGTALELPSAAEPRARRSALLRRLDVLWQRVGSGVGAEPPKPSYRLSWPTQVDERRPDPDAATLPLDLPRIVGDLDRIRAAAGGGQLLLTSFVWMVEPGMMLDPVDQAYFWQTINRTHWPATYADIRRLADFQNRVFAAYAHTRGVPFIDMAGVYPRDPRLFGDAVHRTPDGDRLHAWLLLQQLVPLLRHELKAGRLPSPDRRPYGPADALPAVKRIDVSCAGLGEFVESGDVVGSLVASVPEARVTHGATVTVETPPLRTAYAAELPIVRAADVAGFRVRLRVAQGRVTVGLLSRDRSTWLTTRTVDPTASPVEMLLPLDDAAGGFVLIANAVDADGLRSVVEVAQVQPLHRRPAGAK
jgi:hypothetical protein